MIIISLSLVWRLTGCGIFPSPQFVLLFSYFSYIYLGYLLMLGDPTYNSIAEFGAVGVLIRLGYAAIFLASLATSFIRSTLYYQYLGAVNMNSPVPARLFYSVLALAMIMVAAIYIYLMPANPLKAMLTDSSSVTYARQAVTTDMKNFGVFSNVFYYFMPLVWLSLYFIGRNHLWFVLLVVNLIVVLATGQKAPIVYIIAMFTLAHGLRKGKFSYKFAFSVGVLVLFLLVMLVFLKNFNFYSGVSVDALLASVRGLIKRIFYVGPITLLNYYQTFPNYHPFLSEVVTSIPSDQIVYSHIYGDQYRGTVNTVSLGLFYAWSGSVVFSAFLMFLFSVCVFSIPVFFRYLIPDPALLKSVYVTYCFLMVKFVLTDWRTLVPIFILSFLVVSGLNHIWFHLVQGAVKGNFYIRGNAFAILIALLALSYFTQGQLRILLG
ncbi:hypothetical protein IT895_05430 [Halomonas sp. A40-4]|uniref:hypothetical protein n=1 Tax=Halomonas sp. A40-4 TaxID=2785909 RepID=UPI0018EFAD07|nr:hypothetical protein [Halomonas sp. A40-4]QPL47218.1 hypothetical protein IT895_05430 [Halomonas sp. A40-4]